MMARAAVAVPAHAAAPQADGATLSRGSSHSTETDRSGEQTAQWLAFLGGQQIQPKLVTGNPNDVGENDGQDGAGACPSAMSARTVGAIGNSGKPVGRSEKPVVDAPGGVAGLAQSGASGQSSLLPHLAKVQPLFGTHDVTGVRSFAGPQATSACRRLGAAAYAMSENVVFAVKPSIGLVAHEAAHVIQQREGLAARLAPDVLERNADHVASRVQAGVSAHDLLPKTVSGNPTPAIQYAPDARSQEAERAATEMWGTINDINLLGSEVEFTYYTNNGAMTLVSYKQTKEGKGSASAVSLDDFKRDTLGFKGGVAAGSTLVTFVDKAQRYVTFTFDRQASKWSMKGWSEATNAGPSTPPEGRADPNNSAPGLGVDAYARITDAVAKWLPIMNAYPGGTATMSFSASFSDDRLTDLQNTGKTFNGGKGPAFAPAASFTDMRFGSALRAFAQGLGERKIKFLMAGDARRGDTEWRVIEAATDRGPLPKLPDEAEVIIADYRRMHAEIIRQWKEGVKDAAVYAGMFGAEQLAFWLIGGVVAKGLGTAVELAAPRLIAFIRAGSQGGSRAGAQYLETMIARLPMAERAEMQTLARKAETEGIEALGKAERQSLERLMQKLESLLEAPLAQAEKDTLRGRMGTRFMGEKAVVDTAFQTAKQSYQIHHKLPLEWSHKFPGVDPNGAKNLVGLETEVHRGVNACWTRLRNSGKTGKVDGNTVSRMIDIVEKHFGKWFDKPTAATGKVLETEVQASKQAAYAEIDELVKLL